MIDTVRVRLTLWYVLFFGLLLAAFSVFVYTLLSRTLYARFDQSLLNVAHAVSGEFCTELAENEAPVSSAAQAVVELRLPNVRVAIFDREQLLASNAARDEQINLSTEMANVSLDSVPSFHTVSAHGREGARMAALPTHFGDRDYIVAVAEPLHDLNEQLESIARIFYLGFPASLLVAGVGGFLLAKKSLAPVVAMSNQAERISARNLNERLIVSNQNDELGNLARVFNDLLSRLDRSFEGMRKFMADASHELRTPLSIIRGEADVALSDERDPAEYRDALSIIHDEAKRLSRIVDDMLALARSDAGLQFLQVEEFYLNDVIEECCKAARVLASGKGISLTASPMMDVAFRGDEGLVRRMILNLLDNAIKFTPAGGAVTVALVCESAKVKIVVCDTGVGIPSESVPHVFERFYRANKARSRAEGGSGLGLSIAKWAAEAHKGTIELQSVPGHGSTFTVSLPMQTT